MNVSEIEQKLIEITKKKLAPRENELTRETSFINDLGADSLDTVELIMEIEKEFNISIPDDEAERITTLGDAIDYVEKSFPKS